MMIIPFVIIILAVLLTLFGRRQFFSCQPSAEEMSGHMLRDYRADLQLTDSQLASIAPIVTTAALKVSALQREMATHFGRIMDEMDREVTQHLSKEQRDRFAALKERRPNSFQTVPT